MEERYIVLGFYLLVTSTMFVINIISFRLFDKHTKIKSEFFNKQQLYIDSANEIISDYNDAIAHNNDLTKTVLSLVDYQNNMNQKIHILYKMNPENPNIEGLYNNMRESLENLRKSNILD